MYFTVLLYCENVYYFHQFLLTKIFGNFMVQLNKETVHYLAKLCRIACTEEQENRLLHDMKGVLNYVELLNEIDTNGISPCSNVLESLDETPERPDTVSTPASREEFVKEFKKNLPQQIGGLARVPEVQKKG